MSLDKNLMNFISSDGVFFGVPIKCASMCLALTGKIEEGAVINLPEISSETFTKIIEWLEHWADEQSEPSEELEESLNDHWNETFLKSISQDESMKLVSALHYVEIPEKLFFLFTGKSCKKFANYKAE